MTSAPSLILHHYAFHPASRAARLALGEARLAFSETLVRPWETGCPLIGLNPNGMPPVLEVHERGATLNLVELDAVFGWLEDRAPEPFLLPGDPAGRAEVRRLVAFFERRFTDEVDGVLLHERMEKALMRLGPPDARQLRAGRETLREHMATLEALAAERDWLAGRRLSAADLVAAAHLSVLDYFGEVPWKGAPALKTWYSKIKSRPTLRPLLSDRFPGVMPSAHYTDLDF